MSADPGGYLNAMTLPGDFGKRGDHPGERRCQSHFAHVEFGQDLFNKDPGYPGDSVSHCERLKALTLMGLEVSNLLSLSVLAP